MRQFEASWYDADRIKLSRNRIDRLGYFREVAIDSEPVVGSSDLVDISVKVEERPLGALNLGVGFSSSESLVLSGSISQQNFLGTGTSISLEVNSGKVNKTFAVSHVDPYWTDDGVSRLMDIYSRKFEPEQLESANRYTVTSQGLNVRFGIPYNEEDRIFIGGNYELSKYGGTRVQWPVRVAAEVAHFGTANLDAYSITLGWSRDSRDSALSPTSGVQQYLNFDYATPIGALEFFRLKYGHQRFIPLTRTLTLALNGDLAWGEGLGGRNFPILKNYYAGGIGSVRGFSTAGIGTRDANGAALGGNRKMVLNGELLTALPGMAQDRTIRLFAFVDAGTVWQEAEDVDFNTLRASAGIGLSWLSPVGPLKLSMGNAVRKEAGDRTQRIQFQIGTGF
jgi:outer membrane protein insertion porin family